MYALYKQSPIFGVSGGSSTSDNYSLEEQVIGTWIDGKPLYRKVYQVTTPNGSGNNLDSIVIPADTSIDIVFIKGYINSSTDARVFLNVVEGSNFACAYVASDKSVHMQIIGTWDGYKNRPAILSIDYTKTTDQATIEIPTPTALSAENSLDQMITDNTTMEGE